MSQQQQQLRIPGHRHADCYLGMQVLRKEVWVRDTTSICAYHKLAVDTASITAAAAGEPPTAGLFNFLAMLASAAAGNQQLRRHFLLGVASDTM